MVNKLPYDYECPIDVWLLKFIDTHLDVYYNLGFTPNMITTLSILLGILAAYMIKRGKFHSAAFLVLISYYFDCVDGKLARKHNMVTVFGDYYDHFGDMFKFIVILYALFNCQVDTNYQHLNFIGILFGISIILCIHLGYQERIYNNNNNNNNDSPFLFLFKLFTIFDKNPERTICYTKYFGCGTLILSFILIIILWDKCNGECK